MNQWIILYNKEMLGFWRNYKWMWVPIVFILLGMMNPVTAYYTPQLLEANGLAKEIVKALAVPTGAEVMMKTLSQYNTLGLLILVLTFMGIVASERQSGSAIMVLVKPVTHFTYITAKWASMLSLTIVSFGLGYIATWYYTGILIGSVPFTQIWQSFLVYSVWLLFVVSVTLLYSSLLNSTGGIAFLSLLTLAAFSLLTSLLERYMKWSPGHLSGDAGALVTKGSLSTNLWLPVSVTAMLILVMIYGAAFISKRKTTEPST
jgi:ABC-2 type transport system permease protein